MPVVILPQTLDELLDLKANCDSSAILAGGTDLLVQMRNKKIQPQTLICLDQLKDKGLREVADMGDEISIGAAATHSQLIQNPLVQHHFPILIQALETLGSPQIRNMGTLGGNIMTASPAGDTLPPLYVLDAQVELAGKNGSRRMPISRFITGPGSTCLKPEEILYRIWIPKSPSHGLHHFEKIGHRKSLSIAILSLAALVDLTEEKKIRAVRLAWGSVGKTIITSPETEKLLLGNPMDDPTGFILAAARIREEVSPISDVRARAEYRRQVAGNLVLRLCQGPLKQEPLKQESLKQGPGTL